MILIHIYILIFILLFLKNDLKIFRILIKMELNKDMIFLLAMRLDLPSLLRLCASSKLIYFKINQSFLVHKLIQDFPEYKNLNLNDTKNSYILLYQLNIFKCKMKRRETIDQLYNLEQIYLHDDESILIPKEIGQLQNLQQLYLHKNKLTNIPKEIGNLYNLIRRPCRCGSIHSPTLS